MRQRLAYISESQKIIEELEYSFYSVPRKEQSDTSGSFEPFKELESVVISPSVMFPSITPIVKGKSHGESLLPLLGVGNDSKGRSILKKQISLGITPSCLFPLLESKKRATSMKYSQQTPFGGNIESGHLGAGQDRY
jgi:hypothetical protein